MKKKQIWTGCLIGIVIVIGIGFYFFNKMTSSPEISLSTLKTKDLNGVQINFGERINRKPIVVNFWATWCGPCREEFPEFQNAMKKYSDQVNFIMISDESIEKISTFKNMHPYSFTYVQSTLELDDYGIYSIPATYFYDSEGKLSSKMSGSIKFSDIETEIKKLLQQQ